MSKNLRTLAAVVMVILISVSGMIGYVLGWEKLTLAAIAVLVLVSVFGIIGYALGRERLTLAAVVMVILISVSGMIGHAFGWEWLTTLWGEGATMKATTAISFVVMAVITLLRSFQDFETSRLLSGFVIILMICGLLGSRTETEEAYTVGAMVPSLATIGSFVILALFKGRIGIVVLPFALLAMIGRWIDFPPFYFYFPGISTGMAFNTSLNFAILSITAYYSE